ncbi:hypothetical protein N566_02915 [Streptomycetaceae bacterium MP113-05]|nr:hypothetical protein N566_02915 [Streptomycetaceae bacterium MP113-05]
MASAETTAPRAGVPTELAAAEATATLVAAASTTGTGRRTGAVHVARKGETSEAIPSGARAPDPVAMNGPRGAGVCALVTTVTGVVGVRGSVVASVARTVVTTVPGRVGVIVGMTAVGGVGTTGGVSVLVTTVTGVVGVRGSVVASVATIGAAAAAMIAGTGGAMTGVADRGATASRCDVFPSPRTSPGRRFRGTCVRSCWDFPRPWPRMSRRTS